MTDKVEAIDSSSMRESDIARTITEVEFYPVIVDEAIKTETLPKFPLAKIAAWGTAYKPLTAAFQTILSGGKATSGLYMVTVPNGGQLAHFRQVNAYLGSVLKPNGAVGGGQARLNPLICDPTMLFMAIALANIDKKLDSIQEIQQEILDFLIQKERSELKGDIRFLTDTLNSYKYNWNSEKYKNSNHVKALDIRQAAERKIDFFREQIALIISKTSLFHSDQEVKEQLEKIESEFKDYQLALYLYSFASFLELLLLENFDAAYLECISKKIEEHSAQYEELYTRCYNQLEEYAKSSIQSHLLKGLASVGKAAGEAIAKVPVISKSQIDETLIKTGDRLGSFSIKRTEQTMKQFIEKQSAYVRPFIEMIGTVSRLYDQPMELLFDEENIYLASVET